jgi:hypothetical protein
MPPPAACNIHVWAGVVQHPDAGQRRLTVDPLQCRPADVCAALGASRGSDLLLVFWAGAVLRVNWRTAARRTLAELGVQSGMIVLLDDVMCQ